MTLQETLQAKLANLDAAYVAEKAKIQADMAHLEAWWARDIEEVKAWFTALKNHL
jgi:hypothetical protein